MPYDYKDEIKRLKTKFRDYVADSNECTCGTIDFMVDEDEGCWVCSECGERFSTISIQGKKYKFE